MQVYLCLQIALTDGDRGCVTPHLMIQIEHLAPVLPSVCCGHTRDLQGIQLRIS